MRKLAFSKRSIAFAKKLPPKPFKQIHTAIFELLNSPQPPDSLELSGAKNLFRKDVGEYRIVYEYDTEVLSILLIGKRNDDEVYKQLRRLL
jgi:mRNA interferase RelE/StbE